MWRVRDLPSSSLDIGVVCESVYTPESEYADLRIMSFDVTTCGTAHLITMVFSDSSIKVKIPALLTPHCSSGIDIFQAYCYDPGASTKWVPLAKGLYFTSCLTQCIHLSGTTILTAGTDGHAVTWPLPEKAYGLSTESQNVISKLMWNHPAKIHQNSSKVMVSQSLDNDTTLVVSGGDDGSLAFLLMRSSPSLTTSPTTSYASPPILINRTHASAVTACALYRHESHITLLTSGNDEWVRQWEITLQNPDTKGEDSSQPVTEDVMKVRRLGKVKTSVADVSSMSVLDTSDGTEGARILVCGVGMEVIRVE